ncbi:radical SAM family heme chaperone HemW [Dyadobacter aurulentus]|uniref:radical SAM family heme chaperone HemW n=1 Tax=Dyadobacter sp. UC 10 TaxID=2605428 RepID=UPI0011F22E6F|nr:radical SAM family heme chaperone HemW [Dyadobacter sp. UC 10]KAA0993881.1 radical SAM family heme chaperone HemW [Dyadobacter sp. UC 10]
MHLYVHIPFCKQACHYCDFHFSTNTAGKQAMVEAIAAEISIRKSYLESSRLETIYFGGGTPSVLSKEELQLLLNTISDHFDIAASAEITLEANPDDLSQSKLEDLFEAGVNRLSIGIQSFNEPHLQFLNRAHSAHEAENCVRLAKQVGIDNISIDLIYAIPASDHSILHSDLAKAFELDVAHISAYCLTIEPQTVFGNWLRRKKIQPVNEEFAAEQFEILIDTLAANGYEQYEISNFARNQQYSRHNSSYWKQRPYLGIGPSAHSYNGTSREFNISNNAKYVESINSGHIPATIEELTAADMTNEYLLTGLRTKWGVDSDELDRLSKGKFAMLHQQELSNMKKNGWLKEESGTLVLTKSGKLFADRIASDLFID